MHRHSLVIAIAMTTFVGTLVVALSGAAARGAAGGFSPVTGAYVHLPPQLQPWPQVTQVPIFGGETAHGQPSPPAGAPQSARAPAEGPPAAASTFFAPGVERNSSGHIERSP